MIEVLCSNSAFANRIGQEIPRHWRVGEHFRLDHSKDFSPGEVVVVPRSNGTQTFGVVEKLMASVTLMP